MHLKIRELTLHFTKIHKLLIVEQFTIKCQLIQDEKHMFPL